MGVEKISILASGGLDSSVLIAKLAADAEVYPIYVRCGFAWEDMELKGLQSFLDAIHNPNIMLTTVLSAPTSVLYGDHWSVTGARVCGRAAVLSMATSTLARRKIVAQMV